MKAHPKSKVNTFILELIIVVFIFALAGAISVGLFAKAQNVGQKATNINIAMMKTQSLAETFKSQDTFIMDYISFSGINPRPLYYDQDWQYIENLQSSSSPDQAVYCIAAVVSSEKTVSGLLASVRYRAFALSNESTPLYELQIQKYYPGVEGGGQ